MAVNKVVINGQTKIDLSGDTVAQDKVVSGYTFHDSQGVQKTGTYDPGTSWTAIITIDTLNPKLFNQNITVDKLSTVTATVTLHGAPGATIQYIDIFGLNSTILDSNGEASDVNITTLASDPYVTFIDTDISKLPVNLSEGYFKRVEITNNLTDVYIMPDNVLYWYGYIDNLEKMSSSTGWTGPSGTNTQPGYAANQINYDAYGSGYWCGLGSVTQINAKTVHYIGKESRSNNKGYLTMSSQKSNFVSNRIAPEVTASNVITHKSTTTTSGVAENGYFVYYSVNGDGCIYALWYDTTTPSGSPTFYSAANDVIYIKDSDGRKIPITYTDEEGKSYDPIMLPNGTYTIYSSIAKDPNDLTSDYSKSITITNNTSDIYLMPDNCLYWYGWESDDLEDCVTANGWTTISGRTMDTPVHNTNDIYLISAGSHVCYVGSKNPCDITSSYSAIINSISISSNIGLSVDDLETKYVEYGVNYLSTTGLQVKTVAASGSKYLVVGSNNGASRAGNLYALWYE